MAAAERVHLQGASPGGEGRRHVQDVVHELLERQQPLVRRGVPGAQAARAPALHRQIRRSESARHPDRHRDFEEGLRRHRGQHRAGRNPRRDSGRDVLPRLAGFARQSCQPGQPGDSRLMAVPPIEQVKAQAQILVPLIKALRAELGEEKANAIMRKALGEHFRKLGEAQWRHYGAQSRLEKMERTWKGFGAADALKVQVLKKTPDAYELNVTECQYAKFYKELGEPELGFLFVCSADYDLARGYGDVTLKRTQTIMQGASHCDFRYRLEQEKAPK